MRARRNPSLATEQAGQWRWRVLCRHPQQYPSDYFWDRSCNDDRRSRIGLFSELDLPPSASVFLGAEDLISAL